MTDGLHQHSARLVTHGRYHFTPVVTVFGIDPHLDELMMFKPFVHFLYDGITQTGIADNHDRFECMRECTQVTYLCGFKSAQGHIPVAAVPGGGGGEMLHHPCDKLNHIFGSFQPLIFLSHIPMSRSKSSRRWLKEHFDDEYVKRAQRGGLRSRAIFKLEEIQHKDHILRNGMVVVDLGAAPGGWSQYAAGIVGDKGRVIALDILPMPALAGVEVIEADFTGQAALDQLNALLAGQQPDLVMSDMAPNISGVSTVDQPRAMYLAELALDFARHTLKPGGDFLVKTFQGEGFDEYFRALKRDFNRLVTRKPKASRPRSREVYLLARGYKGL